VAVREVSGLSPAQPEHLADAQVLGQGRLDPFPGKVGIAVGIQEALLRRQERPLAVDAGGSTFQDHGGLVATHPKMLRYAEGGELVPEVGELAAPAVEPEPDGGDPAVGPADEEGSVVPDPGVIQLHLEEVDSRAQGRPSFLPGGRIGEDRHGFEAADGRNDVSVGPLCLAGVAVPRGHPTGPGNVARRVVLPLRGHREAVLLGGPELGHVRWPHLCSWAWLAGPA
jgi:hypothetical protein